MTTISSLSNHSPIRSSSRPVSAGEPQPAGPADEVTLSAPRKSSWLKTGLARTALIVGLGAASLGAFTAPAQAQIWSRPQVEQSQVGINIDSQGRVGVYVGNETYNRATGIYERGGISIGPGGIGIDYGVGVRPPAVHCPPPRTMPWNGGHCPPQTMPYPGYRHDRPQTMPHHGHRHHHPSQTMPHYGHRHHQNQTVIINGPVIINQR